MLTSGANGKIESTLSEVKVCGCCLGSNSNDANEIVECDGCGISVHEVRYRIFSLAERRTLQNNHRVSHL